MIARTRPRNVLVTFLPALLLLGVFLSTETLAAQGVSYSTVSKGEFGGSLGTLMRLVPGSQDESQETTHLQGAFMRTDTEESSTIMDFREGRFTEMLHPDKTFFSYTMEEMMAAMAAGMAGAGAEGAAAEAEANEPEAEEAEVTFEVKLSSERTGRTMEIQGYPAEQFLMLIEVVPTSEEAIKEAADSGSMAVLTELWVSRDFPGWQEVRQAQREAAEAMGSGAVGAQAEALQKALASDPRMQDAYKENLKALEEMDGLAVKTVTSFVTVPPGKTLDKEQVLAMADQPLSEGVGSVVADAAAEAAKQEAAQAARGALRSLTRGVLGRRGGQEEPPNEEAQPEPVQFILMRVTSSVVDVKTGVLADDLFLPTAGYEQIDPPWKGGGPK